MNKSSGAIDNVTEQRDLKTRKKRIVFRSGHRGTQEFDLIIGGFVKSKIDAMSEHQVSLLEEMLNESDAQISDWMNGVEVPPEKFKELIADIKSYTRTMKN